MRRGQYCSNLMALILASDGSTPVAHIMAELLDMNAIAKLDSAIVGGLLREEFLASLKHWNIFNGLGAGTIHILNYCRSRRSDSNIRDL